MNLAKKKILLILLMTAMVFAAVVPVWAVTPSDPLDNSTTLADGTYMADTVTCGKVAGGTSKVKFSVDSITVSGGKATAVLRASSKMYTKFMVGGTEYETQNDDNGSFATVPVKLNEEFVFSGTTTAMGNVHTIDYFCLITVGTQAFEAGRYKADDPGKITEGNKMFRCTEAVLTVGEDGTAILDMRLSGWGYDSIYFGNKISEMPYGAITQGNTNNLWTGENLAVTEGVQGEDPQDGQQGYRYSISIPDIYASALVGAHSKNYDQWSHKVLHLLPSDFSKIKDRRIAGENRYETAILAAEERRAGMAGQKFSAVVITSGMAYADGLGGARLAWAKNAPILLINEATEARVTEYAKSVLKDDGNVYILGGTGVVSDSVEKSFGGYTVKRLWGADRYDTNIQILKEIGLTHKNDVLVCSGKDFADALSASVLGQPIMLVGDVLTDNQKKYLDELAGASDGSHDTVYTTVGGPGAVSEDLEKAVASAVSTYASTDRVFGANRYETSVELAKKGMFASGTVVLAAGDNFPDGLSASPIAYINDAPILLVNTGRTDYAKEYVASNAEDYSITFGGPTIISDGDVAEIMGR